MTTTEQPQSQTPENEIRVSGKTSVLKAVERVEEAFKNFENVTISGINTGISKVLLITEIIKLKIVDLHQYNLIETITREIKEEDKEPKEDEKETPRYLTRFKVELYKKKLDSVPKNAFYEAPYTEEQVTKIKEVKPQEDRDRPRTAPRGGFRRGRGRGDFRRGGRGEGRGGRGEGREGRGGRGRGGRGEGRGGRGRGGAPRSARGGERKERGGRGAPRGQRGGASSRGGAEKNERGGRGEGRGGRGRGGKKGDVEGL